MIKAVLFDLDETLIDKAATLRVFLPSQYRRFRLDAHAVDEQGYVREFLALEKAGVVRKRDLYPRLAESFGLDHSVAAALFKDFEDVYPGMAVLMPDARETILALKQSGLWIGVISNGEGNVQTSKIAATGLTDCLDVIIISAEVGIRKPAREIFQLAAARLSLPAESCLFVGDNPEADIVGAQNAGMQAVYFGPGGSWPAFLPLPRYRIEALGALVALVREICAPSSETPQAETIKPEAN